MSKHFFRTVHSSAKHFDSAYARYRSVVVLVLSVFSFGNLALAQDVMGAAKAFSRAQKAELAEDHEMAAELFELADSLAPSPEALRSALRSRKSAGQLATAALHAETLRRRYPYDTKSQELVRTTLMEAKQTLMRFAIECKPIDCTVMVDDAAAAIEPGKNHVIYVEPGTHEVIASFDDVQSDPQFVEATAGKRDALVFIYDPDKGPKNRQATLVSGANSSADNSNAKLEIRNGEGLSFWYFLSGAAITFGAGVATVWSGLDVLDLHDAYEKNQTREIYESGRDKELRTNILIGVTAVAASATVVLAIFTQWDDSQETDSQNDLKAAVDVGSNNGLLKISGTF